MVQLAGHDMLKAKGITLMAAAAPTFFLEDTPAPRDRPPSLSLEPVADRASLGQLRLKIGRPLLVAARAQGLIGGLDLP